MNELRAVIFDLGGVTPANLFPGVRELVSELRAAGILDAVIDGNAVTRGTPAPDVFLQAAKDLGVPAGLCAVVVDAEAGVTAALAAGMWSVGVGPAERVGHAHVRLAEGLDGFTLDLLRASLEDAAWTVTERAFSPERQHHLETVFTVGNGQHCVRGSFEEGYPGERSAAFMHQVWDDMPVAATELAALPRWWGVDLWVDGHRFRLDHGRVLSYRRSLDLRTGVLSRSVGWQAPSGAQVDLHFERFVDLSQADRAVVRVQVSADRSVELRTRAGLDAHVDNTGLLHWTLVGQESTEDSAWLSTRTRATGITLASACEVVLEGAQGHGNGTDADGAPAVEHQCTLDPQATVTLTKFVSVVPDFVAADPASVAVEHARQARILGWDAALAANTSAWDASWQRHDVVIDGDPEAQLALRFNLFQLLVAAPRFTDRASIGAKTLSGYGYRHHVFWDTEIFMVPPFTFTDPAIARNMLMYRWHGLAGARRKAARNGYRGAQFPWEAAQTGDEVTPTWVPHFANPSELIRIWTGDIEIHITADIAYAVLQFWRATGDDAFMVDFGAEMVLEGARFWATAATFEPDGLYHYRDVIGPDEYHDRIDDNAYTNAFAQWHLRAARDVAAWLATHSPERWAGLQEALSLDAAEVAGWADVASAMFIPVDPVSGLMEQFSGYFAMTDVDFETARDPHRTSSMQELLGIEGCSATQNLKQPDVLMLAYLLPELFTEDALRANYAYYDPRTDHELGSSLGPAISAVMACRAGDPDVGYQHFLRAARADLLDVRHNAGDGIHGASAGGLWQAAVFGFAGLSFDEEGPRTEPMLPASWERVSFTIEHRGEPRRIVVER